MPENSCLRRIHDIVNSIRMSYLFAQAKKENYGVVLWQFYETACLVIQKYIFFVSI